MSSAKWRQFCLGLIVFITFTIMIIAIAIFNEFFIHIKTLPPIPTLSNRILSAIGGGKPRSCLAGWVQLSVEAAPGPHRQRHPVRTEDSGAADDNKMLREI